LRQPCVSFAACCVDRRLKQENPFNAIGNQIMGILDGLLNAAVSSMQGGSVPPVGLPASNTATAAGMSPAVLMNVVSALMHSQGGLSGLLNSFNQAGLGNVVSSWIGTGQNLPVSAAQVTQVLGSGQLSQIASQLGVDPAHVGGLLAQMLPHVVDQLTPHGQLPPQANTQGDLLNAALGAITGKLFSGH
jgi:uncharacterized protein YidB (DUF937 family)